MITSDRKTLYRDPKKGKLFGVCAGLAEYFSVETWTVRFAVIILGFIFTFGLVGIAYLIAFFVLERKPDLKTKSKVWVEEKKEATVDRFKERIKEAKATFKGNKIENRELLEQTEEVLQNVSRKVKEIEAFVTSSHYELNKEFRKMRE